MYIHRYMVEEGRAGHCRMMSVGLHCRIVGRPGRCAGLADFLDYAKKLGKDVWICTREDIANHWHEHYYPRGAGTRNAPEKSLKSASFGEEEADDE